MNHYEVLGIGRKARLADIKKAYRKLARKYHPDLNPGDARAEARFKQITEACEALSDPQKRKAHDLQLDLGGPSEASPGGPGDGGPRDLEADCNPAGAGGGIASFFSEILGGRGAEAVDRHAARMGEDLTCTLSVGFFDALHGVTSELILDAETACSRCDGSGAVPSRSRRPCPDCAGTGRISHASGLLRFASTCARCNGEGMLGWEGCGTCGGRGVRLQQEKVKIHVPAGVDDGSRVRIAGKGRAGRNGGPPGDLYIVTRVEPHPLFRRIGDNIHCTVPITVTEAALGTRIEVPTIDGKARIRIPPGTENGQKFRLRGKGAPSLRGSVRGDHYVEVCLTTPSATDERSRRILKELGEMDSGEELRRRLFAGSAN